VFTLSVLAASMPRRIGEVKAPGLASQHQPFFHWQYILPES